MLLKIHHYNFVVDENMENYIKLRNYYLGLAVKSVDTFRPEAAKQEELWKLWGLFRGLLSECTQNLCEISCKILFDIGIHHVSTELFLEKYFDQYLNIDEIVEPLVDSIQGIEEYSKALKNQREIRKMERGHWTGGGFGVTGAMKGALTASAFNAVGGIMHGIGDAIRSSGDSSKVNKKQQELLHDPETLNIMCRCLYHMGMGAFYGVAEELVNEGYLEPVPFSAQEAKSLKDNALKYASSREQMQNLMVESIMKAPIEFSLYPQLIGEFPDTEGLMDFAAYFGMDFTYQCYRKYLVEAKHNQILAMPSNTIEQICEQIKELEKCEKTYYLDLYNTLVWIMNRVLAISGPSAQGLKKSIEFLETSLPEKEHPRIVKVLEKLVERQNARFQKEIKDTALNLPENNIETCIQKITAVLDYFQNYKERDDEVIKPLLLKLNSYIESSEQIRNAHVMLSQLDTSTMPILQEFLAAWEYKQRLMKLEEGHQIRTVQILSPDILDLIQSAREGNPACQYWAVRAFCPDMILENSILENGKEENVGELPESFVQTLSELISFFFDQPEKYPFDLFMRLRLNLNSLSRDVYLNSVSQFQDARTCPSGVYEFGKYLLISDESSYEKGLYIISVAAKAGYYPALRFMRQLESSKYSILPESQFFYQILQPTYSRCNMLYKHNYDISPYINQYFYFIEFWKSAIWGAVSFHLLSIEDIVKNLRELWKMFCYHDLETEDLHLGFHRDGIREDPNLLKVIRDFGIRMNSGEYALFSYHDIIEERRGRKVPFRTVLMTTSRILWLEDGKAHEQFYSDKTPVDYCHLPDTVYLGDAYILWQCYSLISYSRRPYQENDSSILLNKMALECNAYAISRLLKEETLSEDRREIWEAVHKKWEKDGQYYGVCPQCYGLLKTRDPYCTHCGAKI